MPERSDDFRQARARYQLFLERALTYFLEDESAARWVAVAAFQQAGRQWEALEGEANLLHLIGLAAADQCELLLPRSVLALLKRQKPKPTAVQIIRHLEWYDWEERIERLRTAIEVKRASAKEAGATPASDAEIASLNAKLTEIIQILFQSPLGLTDEDDNAAGGGIACEVPEPPPSRGPGTTRTFDDAIAAARNP